MKQEWENRKYLNKYWRPNFNGFPLGNPGTVLTILQDFSQDLMYSENNLVSMLGRTRQRIGGPFLVVKRTYSEYSSLGEGPHHFSKSANPLEEGINGHYHTPVFAYRDNFSNASFPSVTPSPASVMNALGSEAIRMTAPTRSEADLSTFLGELREGLPRGIGVGRTGPGRTRRAINAGDEYLNVEFGWRPLIRDVQSFAQSVRNSEAILADYRSRSGKLIKRSYRFPIEATTNVTVGTGLPSPHLGTGWYQSGGWNGTLTTTTRTRTERWFSAAYTYYVPEGKFASRASEANKLLGTNLDPDMLWNLAPWSWALDWVGNMGTLAENASLLSTDSLVMPYAYMMETKTVSVEYQLSGIRYKSYPGEQTFRQTFTTDVKQRTVATPYGFGLDWDGFTPKQVAILAALGISRRG